MADLGLEGGLIDPPPPPPPAPEENASGSIRKEGTVYRWRNYFLGWQPRFVVIHRLADGRLVFSSFYKKDGDFPDKPIDVVDIKTTSLNIPRTDPRRFDLTQPSGSLYFRTDNALQRAEWVDLLVQLKGEMIALENNMDVNALPLPVGVAGAVPSQSMFDSQVSVQSEDWLVMDMSNVVTDNEQYTYTFSVQIQEEQFMVICTETDKATSAVSANWSAQFTVEEFQERHERLLKVVPGIELPKIPDSITPGVIDRMFSKPTEPFNVVIKHYLEAVLQKVNRSIVADVFFNVDNLEIDDFLHSLSEHNKELLEAAVKKAEANLTALLDARANQAIKDLAPVYEAEDKAFQALTQAKEAMLVFFLKPFNAEIQLAKQHIGLICGDSEEDPVLDEADQQQLAEWRKTLYSNETSVRDLKINAIENGIVWSEKMIARYTEDVAKATGADKELAQKQLAAAKAVLSKRNKAWRAVKTEKLKCTQEVVIATLSKLDESFNQKVQLNSDATEEELLQLVERVKEAEIPYVETATGLFRIKLMRYEEETSEIESKIKGASPSAREKIDAQLAELKKKTAGVRNVQYNVDQFRAERAKARSAPLATKLAHLKTKTIHQESKRKEQEQTKIAESARQQAALRAKTFRESLRVPEERRKAEQLVSEEQSKAKAEKARQEAIARIKTAKMIENLPAPIDLAPSVVTPEMAEKESLAAIERIKRYKELKTFEAQQKRVEAEQREEALRKEEEAKKRLGWKSDVNSKYIYSHRETPDPSASATPTRKSPTSSKSRLPAPKSSGGKAPIPISERPDFVVEPVDLSRPLGPAPSLDDPMATTQVLRKPTRPASSKIATRTSTTTISSPAPAVPGADLASSTTATTKTPPPTTTTTTTDENDTANNDDKLPSTDAAPEEASISSAPSSPPIVHRPMVLPTASSGIPKPGTASSAIPKPGGPTAPAAAAAAAAPPPPPPPPPKLPPATSASPPKSNNNNNNNNNNDDGGDDDDDDDGQPCNSANSSAAFFASKAPAGSNDLLIAIQLVDKEKLLKKVGPPLQKQTSAPNLQAMGGVADKLAANRSMIEMSDSESESEGDWD